jgi:hypothetical protein
MDLQKFTAERPYLYHLTSRENADNILSTNTLFSANTLIDMTNDALLQSVKKSRRADHQALLIGGKLFYLRDQRPISEKALSKCLTNNWSVGDFLFHLNDRVFMWPTVDRLWKHFNRYEKENPIIFRFSTPEILEANSHAKFCRLNSGATRPSSYLGGIAPRRGIESFVDAEHFDRAIRDVAEVTFDRQCTLIGPVWTSSRPDGNFERLN